MVGTTHLTEDQRRIKELEKENQHLRQVNGQMATWGGTLQAELMSAQMKLQEKEQEITEWIMRSAEQPPAREKRKIYPVAKADDEPREG